jgi:hypothetical protein
MNWEALGAVGEIVGAIAVVLTLGYLAVQIRQNTHSVRSSTHQDVTATSVNILLGVLQTPGSSEILARGRAGLDPLNDAERIAFSRLYFAVFRGYENLFYQYKRGLLEAAFWDGYEFVIRSSLAHPGVREWWNEWEGGFNASFRNHVRQLQAAEADRP